MNSLIDQAHWSILRRYLSIPNTDQANISEKWMGLKGLGYTDEQCERECRPKEVDVEEQMALVAEACRKEQRELAKYNKEQAKLRKLAKEREERQTRQQIAPELIMESFDGLKMGFGT